MCVCVCVCVCVYVCMYLNEESLGLIAVMMMMMVSKSCEREENTHKAPEGVGMHAQNQINVVLNVPLLVVCLLYCYTCI